MSYSNSPLLPKVRRQAVNLVLREGFRVATTEETENKLPEITLSTRICKLLVAAEKPLNV